MSTAITSTGSMIKPVEIYVFHKFTENKTDLDSGVLFTKDSKIAENMEAFVRYNEYDKLHLAYRSALATIQRLSSRKVLNNKGFSISDRKFFGPFAAEFEERMSLCKEGLEICDKIMLSDQVVS